jgi:HTH-type transcriptional repressor of NAD biosynthesis genes
MSKKGLVLGKFMPLHLGHLALIAFAKQQCDVLYVLVCANDDIEPIRGNIRLQWMQESIGNNEGIEVHYTDEKIPYTPYSDRLTSQRWGDFIQKRFPDCSVLISSEDYGDYVAEYLGIQHIPFDKARSALPISGTLIRDYPLRYWNYLVPAARAFFVIKIVICGTESTGKSTLSRRLAAHFGTNYVSEMAREVVNHSDDVLFEELEKIAIAHANEILEKVKTSQRLLLIDTDILTTQSYATFLFQKELLVPSWVTEANRMDCYLFLDNDVPFIQDGTRLCEQDRNLLQEVHLSTYQAAGAKIHRIEGNWAQRFETMCTIISDFL